MCISHLFLRQPVPEPVIQPLPGQQRLVGSFLLDALAAQHENPVRVADGSEPVRDGQGRPAVGQPVQTLSHQHLALVIQG